jgi:hypothetical protein
MNILMTNPWLFFLAIVWVICGLTSAIQKSHKPLEVAAKVSFYLGIFYLIVKHI